MNRTVDELTVDEELYGSSYHIYASTSIYVSAKLPSMSKWESVDISLLDSDSMDKWLHSKSREYLEEVIRVLTGHEVSRC
jgi:hypothetical protein